MKLVPAVLSTLLGSSIAAPPAVVKKYNYYAGNQCDPTCVACLTLDRVYVDDKVDFDTTGGIFVTYKTRNFYIDSFSIDVNVQYVCLDKVTPDDYVTDLRFDKQSMSGYYPFGITAYINYTGTNVGGYPNNNHFIDVFGGAVQDQNKNYGLTTNLWLHTQESTNQFSKCSGQTRCSAISTQQLVGESGFRSLSDYNQTTSCAGSRCDAWLILNQASINGVESASNGKTCFQVQISYYDNAGGAHVDRGYPVEVDNQKGSQAIKFPLSLENDEFVSAISINKPNVCKGDGFQIDDGDDWWLQSIEVVYPDNPSRFSDLLMTQGINEKEKKTNANSSPQSMMRIGGTAPNLDNIPDSAFMMHGACDSSMPSYCQMFSSTFNYNYELLWKH